MALVITNGRRKKCKQQIGGIKNAYLAPYKKVLRSEIDYDGVSLFEFPQTFVYKFELIGSTFEQQQDSQEGGKAFNQRIDLTFNKLTPFDNLNFQKLLKKDYFIVVQDNNNNYFLLGFRNGMYCENLNTSLDQQYRLSFTGLEEKFAPFCEDIMGTDIIIVDGVQKLFQDGDLFIFQDDFNYIFQ